MQNAATVPCRSLLSKASQVPSAPQESSTYPPMFRNRPKDISVLLQQFLRDNCLETPMLQQRLLNVWEEVAGDTVAKYTEEKTIKNQKLIVKISNSALRADLQMKRTALKDALNKRVGAFIISDIILR